MNKKLSAAEWAVLALVALVLIIGFVLFYTNRPLFDRYVVEDGVVEWLTVLGALMGALVSFKRVWVLRGKRKGIFLLSCFVLGLLLFLVAGEEVSWGQRQLHIESSEFFKKNNTQAETNFHNLVIEGKKVNKIVFTFGLIGVLSIYLAIFPIVYKRSKAIQAWADGWGIPVPQAYQVLAFVLLFVITALLKHEKNAELLECGGALLFFLIVRYPKNENIFNKAMAR